MPFTNADWLPGDEALTVPEINMTAAPLRAGAHHFGKYCDQQSKEFMLCSKEEKDPRKCLNEGKEVTRCGLDFFRQVKNSCASEFTSYWQCLDDAGPDMQYRQCRKTQAAFDNCMSAKLGMERPEVGFFSKVRVHSTTRPKPERDVPLPEPVPGIENVDPNQPKPESTKLGHRFLI